jgi:hypothetical protein
MYNVRTCNHNSQIGSFNQPDIGVTNQNVMLTLTPCDFVYNLNHHVIPPFCITAFEWAIVGNQHGLHPIIPFPVSRYHAAQFARGYTSESA